MCTLSMACGVMPTGDASPDEVASNDASRSSEVASNDVSTSADAALSDDAEDIGSVAEEEQWSTADDPGRIAAGLERSLGRLPTSGAARVTPWAGSYWPAVQDSINYRWAGPNTASPARKYGLAFGVGGVEDRVSATFGVNSVWGRACTSDSQCNRGADERCGLRAGYAVGRCIPEWHGVCDGWAAASILTPEPRRPVTINGVTFQVEDIKALLSLIYAHGGARVVSLSCTASLAGGTLGLDRLGRPVASACRDTNPGTFHIILANFLGRYGRSFIEDRTFDEQVWNQPMRSYRVLAEQMISAQEANRLVGVSAPQYWFNAAASRFAYVKTAVWYVTESPSEQNGYLGTSINRFTESEVYEYVLELDGAGGIIGGEWVGASKRRHPDYLWIPTGARSSVAGAIQFNAVRSIAAASY